MELGLAGRVALISGGSSGLGFATALELAREGARVAIGGRDRGRLAAARRRLAQATGADLHTTSIDVTDAEASARWVDQVAADLGGLHIVVVSGGSPPTGSALQFGLADYQSALSLVLLPAITLALAAVPHLTAAGWGRLLFVASETASEPVAPLALSGVTRGGLTRFAQALAPQVARSGVTVNVLAPGATRTELVERAAARLTGDDGDLEEQLTAMGAHTAVGRLARPDEFAAVAAFLASERASYVTGTVHLIDGGASVMAPDLQQYEAPEAYA
jgi:3-oxoacyl-[acyl-carrier protein] reductase